MSDESNTLEQKTINDLKAELVGARSSLEWDRITIDVLRAELAVARRALAFYKHRLLGADGSQAETKSKMTLSEIEAGEFELELAGLLWRKRLARKHEDKEIDFAEKNKTRMMNLALGWDDLELQESQLQFWEELLAEKRKKK